MEKSQAVDALPDVAPDRDSYRTRARRAALTSAVYHANRDELGRAPPYPLAPLSLDDLVKRMQGDEQKYADHAAAWLVDNERRAEKHRPYVERLVGKDISDAIYQLLPFHSSGPGPERELKFIIIDNQKVQVQSSCIDLTGGSWPEPRAFVREDEAHWPDTKTAVPRFAVALGVIDSVRNSNKQKRVMRDSKPAGPGHDAIEIKIDVPDYRLLATYDPETQVSSVEVRLHTSQVVDSFKDLADPQNWHTNAPMFFKRSDLVSDDSGTYVKVPRVAPGAAFSNLLLLEEVTMSLNPWFPLNGINVLRASASCRLEAEQRWMNYCDSQVALHASQETTIGVSSEVGGLDVDGGGLSVSYCGCEKCIRATGGTGGSWLRSVKLARFTERELCGIKLGRWLNQFAVFTLAPWMALMLYDGAHPGPAASQAHTLV